MLCKSQDVSGPGLFMACHLPFTFRENPVLYIFRILIIT